MTPEQQAPLRAFVPFDHTGELAPGFLVADGRVGPEMRLYDANEGIVPFGHDLESYLERLIETRGYYYFSRDLDDKHSLERQRYDRAMSILWTRGSPIDA